jgi:hypothetical protein
MHLRVLFLVTGSFALSNGSRAESDASRELDRVLLDRERAVSAAVIPVNQRYVHELERLLKIATEAKDTDTAARIKSAIEQLKQPPIFRGKEAVVGLWSFKNESDGHTASIELHADHSYTAGGKRIGRWRIEGNQIVISLDEGGHEDRYSLPVNGGKLKGTNRLGHTLTLTRLPQDPLNVL